MSCGIYSITNIINNKKYIGYSLDIERRWKHHIHHLNTGKHDNSYLQKSWERYGEKSFVFEILELCNKEDLVNKEKDYIHNLNTKRPNGYNLTDGGDGNKGWVISEETREKKSKAVSGKLNPMFGKRHSDETKKLFSIQRIGTKNGVGNKNNLYKIKRYKNSNSKYFGVSKQSYTKKDKTVTITWVARFSINGKDFKLGRFKEEVEAARAFDKKSWEIYEDLSKLNFPEEYRNRI